MKKRILSLLLSLLLIMSFGSSALAAGSDAFAAAPSSGSSSGSAVSERLTEVTLIVKNTLGIGDEYTGFYGNLNDRGIRQIWTLNWSNDNEALTVYADQSGKILYYSRSNLTYNYRYDYNFAPKFPSVTREQALAAANAFLGKVLGKNETCNLISQSEILNPSDVEVYYFYGTLKLNGLDSPISISISVSTTDQKVSYFSRSDNYTEYIGTLPTASPVTTREKASGLLAGTIKMTLQYVLADSASSDAKDGRMAVLRYLPIVTGDYVVNAKTGELIDINKIIDDINRGLTDENAAAQAETADTAKSALSPAEQEGIAKLDGVLTKEQLDSAARAITELGILPDYTLNNVSYYLNNNTGDVTAYLSYSLRINPESKKSSGSGLTDKEALQIAAGEYDYVTFINKSLTMDAKTGAFKSISTSYPYNPEYKDPEISKEQIRLKAEAFLDKYFGEYYGKTAAYEDASEITPYYYSYKYYSPSEAFTYCQKENGYFFPVNRLNISVNAETGYIDNFSMSWTENVTFETPDNIISYDEACAKYAAAYDTKLSYISLPVEIDPSRPDLVPYAELGYTYLYELILGYRHYSENYITGVSAKTGEVIFIEPYKEPGISEYADMKGHYAEEKIMKLSQYGIGFPGKSFKPNDKLTQLDMIILLMSADGYRLYNDNPSESEIDQLYNAAYYRNILKKGDKNPTKLITRSDLVRTILTMSGYDKTANLKGIYVCSFSDAKSISEADYGYFAIAQGLGIIKGDDKGNANPYSVVSRVEAALMLYNFMSR